MSRYHKREGLFRKIYLSITGGNQEVEHGHDDTTNMNLTDDNYNGLTSPPIHNNPFQPEESGNAMSSNSASGNCEDETGDQKISRVLSAQQQILPVRRSMSP
ncbi:uncharacterized protein LOC111130308 isoform X1 [Crassostrea virginica]